MWSRLSKKPRRSTAWRRRRCAAELNDQLRRDRDAAVAENEALRCLTEEDARLQEDNNRLQRRVEELRRSWRRYRRRTTLCAGLAGEYQSLKEHVADIEISAHRRTEEFRAKAMERLAQCIAQQRVWCRQRRSTYLTMNAALSQQLRARPGGGRQRGLHRL